MNSNLEVSKGCWLAFPATKVKGASINLPVAGWSAKVVVG